MGNRNAQLADGIYHLRCIEPVSYTHLDVYKRQITITVLTLAAVNTLGIPVDLPTALLLSVVASLCACGASGVAGGSLLLIPLACNMFGISNDIAMQVVCLLYTSRCV